MAFVKWKNIIDDAKNAAVQHFGEEKVEGVLSKVEKVKDFVDEAKTTASKYIGPDTPEDVIAKMEKKREDLLKRAPQILAADFSKEKETYEFYINYEYDKPYTQAEWIALYKELSAQDDPNALAPMYNAIVVDSLGILHRRGLEFPSAVHYIRINPGKNDMISDMYAVEPCACTGPTAAQRQAYIASHRSHFTSSSSNSYSTSTQSSAASSYSSNRLTPSEKTELDNAKRRYEQAMSRATYHRNDSDAAIYADAEKRAQAEYMRVVAKYAGRG